MTHDERINLDLLNTELEKVINELSWGEIQKLKIARALNRSPKLLLLDEMFSHINKSDVGIILKNILVEYPKIIIILIEHHDDSTMISKVFKIEDKPLLKIK